MKIPQEQHKQMRMQDQVEAIVWMGVSPAKDPAQLSKETCSDPDYLPMRLGRIALAGLPVSEAKAAKRACGVKQGR